MGPGSHELQPSLTILGAGIPRAVPIHVRGMMKLNWHEMQSLAGDLGPDDGLDPRAIIAHEPRPRSNRKTLQLCVAVQRTLNAVLAGECGDKLLREVVVVSVVPAPHAARLL